MAKMLTRKRQHSQVESESPVHLYPKRSSQPHEEFTYSVTPENYKIIKIFNWTIFSDLSKDLERKGSEKDVLQLNNVFSKMKYEVENFQNLTREETMKELNKISKMELLDTTDKLIIVVMSHGDEKDGDSFLTSDGKSINMDEIRNMFSNSNCPKFKGKPKIFICGFCRGVSEANEKCLECLAASFNEAKASKSKDEIDDAVEIINLTDEFLSALSNDFEERNTVAECNDYVNNSKQIQLPSLLEEKEKHITKSVEAMWLSTEGLGLPSPPVASSVDDLEDMVTIYASEKGLPSYRHEREGAVMIQCLCSVIEEHGQDHNLDMIFYFLQKKMKEKKSNHVFPNGESFSPEMNPKQFKIFKFC